MKVKYYEPRLIIMKLHKNVFMRVYRIDPRFNNFNCFKAKNNLTFSQKINLVLQTQYH